MVTALIFLRKRKSRTIMFGFIITIAVCSLFAISGSYQTKYDENAEDDYEAFYDSLMSARGDAADAQFNRQHAATFDVVFVQEMKGVRVPDDQASENYDTKDYNENTDDDETDPAYDSNYYSDETTNPTRARHTDTIKDKAQNDTESDINARTEDNRITQKEKPNDRAPGAESFNKIHKNRSVLNIDSGRVEEDVKQKSFGRRIAVSNVDPDQLSQRKPCPENTICKNGNDVIHVNTSTKRKNLEQQEAKSAILRRVETQIPPVRKTMHAKHDQHPATQIQMPDLPEKPGEVRSRSNIPVVVDRIFWSAQVEEGIPKGNTNADFHQFRRSIARGHVDVFERSTWNRCGRPKNHFVTLHDGTSMCARYRHPHNKFIRGDVLSYYLSRMLGLDNVPMVTLAEVSSGAPLWQGKNLSAASWTEDTITSLSQWIPGLSRANLGSHVMMPDILLDAYEAGVPLSYKQPLLADLDTSTLQMLLQWSDMIVFDYITGNYDRVASMQDGVREQGNKNVMRERIRNLRRDPHSNRLWLIDNESGLVDAYDELYHSVGESAGRFLEFHQRMLHAVCVFRRGTLAAVASLASVPSPTTSLVALTLRYEPLYARLPPDGLQTELLKENFATRLREVLDWAHECSRLN